MIVDFPCQSPSSSACCINSNPSPRTPGGYKHVRFAQYSQMSVYSTDPTLNSWTSRQDERRAKHEMGVHARWLGKLFETTPPELVTQEHLLLCVGMENLLSQELFQATHDRRRAHINAVLSAQRASFEPAMIARVSERTSQWAREKATTRAEVYATTLKKGNESLS